MKLTFTEDGYLNEFHKKWSEECMRSNEMNKSKCYSAEFARAQSQRMKDLIQKEEDERRRKRKEEKLKKTKQ